MALSGTLDTSAYGNRHLTFSWTATQSIEKNTTTISWTLKGAGSHSGYYLAAPFTVVIDGDVVYYSTTRIELYNGTTVASGTKTITHNADGTRSFKVDMSAAIYYFDVNVWNNKTWTLDTIPRASGVSCAEGYIGSPLAISISRHSTAFTHSLSYAFGSATGSIKDKTTETSIPWTPDIELCKQIPSALSGTCTITCDTYNGTSKIGSSSCKVKIAVPDWVQLEPNENCGSVNPYNTGTEAANISEFVQGYSKAEVTFIPENIGTSKAYGATPKSYYISFAGTNSTTSPYRTGVINTAGAKQITCYVVDTRNRTTSFTLPFTVQAYSSPTLSDVSIFRCDQHGNKDDNGTYIYAKATATYSDLAGNNNVTFDVGYAVQGGGITERKTMPSGEALILGDGYVSTNSTYIVEIRLIDRLNRGAIYTDYVPTEKVFLQGGFGGNSAGFGKPPERDNVLDVAWDLQTRGDLYIGEAGHKVADFVIEEGFAANNEADQWQYRKWRSGRIELWLCKTMDSGAFSGDTAGVYYSTNQITIPWPDGFTLGTENAVTTISVNSSGIVFPAKVRAWAERGVSFYVGRFYGGKESISIDVQVYVSDYFSS